MKEGVETINKNLVEYINHCDNLINEWRAAVKSKLALENKEETSDTDLLNLYLFFFSDALELLLKYLDNEYPEEELSNDIREFKDTIAASAASHSDVYDKNDCMEKLNRFLRLLVQY